MLRHEVAVLRRQVAPIEGGAHRRSASDRCIRLGRCADPLTGRYGAIFAHRDLLRTRDPGGAPAHPHRSGGADTKREHDTYERQPRGATARQPKVSDEDSAPPAISFFLAYLYKTRQPRQGKDASSYSTGSMSALSFATA